MDISVIIPSGPEHELKVLESLKNQEKRIKQIIVVRGRNTSQNRNKGVKNARGDLIAFTNSHSSFPENWTANIEEFFNQHPEIDVVGGPQLTSKDEKGFAKISGYALCSKFGAANVRSRYQTGKLDLNADETVLTSSNLICKKEVFEKVAWDETIYPGEDPKFVEDCKKAGLRVAYCPKIVGYNKRRGSIRGLAKQIFNYGFMRTKKESFFKTIKMPLFLIPSIFVLYLIFLAGFGIVDLLITGGVTGRNNFNWSGWLILPLVLYLTLNLVFSFYESIKNKDLKAVFVLPFVYPVIHLSYGVGMVLGYFRKLRRK